MKPGKLLVIGDRKIVNIFKLLGSEGIAFIENNVEGAIKYIDKNSTQIGGILLTEDVYEPDSKLIKKINLSDLPWVVLPSKSDEKSENTGYQELEKLAEKAIGMKLNF